MPIGFIKLNRSDQTVELLKDLKAFGLLTQIAYRARRVAGYVTSANGVQVWLDAGQAFIGDYDKLGLTVNEYRRAKERLIKSKIITVTGTNRGTIATLINNDVYDISIKDRTNKEQTRNVQGTTIKNEKKVKKEKNV